MSTIFKYLSMYYYNYHIAYVTFPTCLKSRKRLMLKMPIVLFSITKWRTQNVFESHSHGM